MGRLRRVFDALMDWYGPQGWWPLGPAVRYHKGKYDQPSTGREVFEVYIGAILTQNSTWTGACQAMGRLRALRAMTPRALLALPDEVLEEAVRPARYLRQKARYLRAIASFFLLLKGRIPSREELLTVRGVGKETADSILLYAHHQPVFVVDAYTRRVMAALGVIRGDEEYDTIRALFEKELPADEILYNEYHALFVEHARRYYSKKPYGTGDPLITGFPVKRKRQKDTA
mgnify:CR=1 FL=1